MKLKSIYHHTVYVKFRDGQDVVLEVGVVTGETNMLFLGLDTGNTSVFST